MNKSIFTFISGVLFGVVTTFAIVKTTTSPEKTVQATPSSASKTVATIEPAQAPVQVVETVQMQVDKMKLSGMPLESMSDMEVRLSQEPGTLNTEIEGNADTMSSSSASATVSATSTNSTTSTELPATTSATVPSTAQIQQYNDIEETISLAANNPKIKLDYLIQKADKLTIEQRNALTKKTMEMLDSGELSIDQFASK